MKAVGIILAGGRNISADPIGKHRSLSAFPVASSFRAIDFTMSNMSNSGIGKIAVITQFNTRSLHDHLSSSKWWNIGRKSGGLYILAPHTSNVDNTWYTGTADSIHKNMSFLKRSHEKYVVVANGDCISKIDYRKIIKEHKETNADITVAVKKCDYLDHKLYGNVILDESNRVIEFEEKPLNAISDIISIGVYVMKRELLVDILETLHNEGRTDFVRDIIIRYRKHLNIKAYMHTEYWRSINSIDEYYKLNMDFLNRDVYSYFFNNYPYIMTKNKDEPPAKYNYCSKVQNSIVGTGSIISGEVYSSVVFRNVTIDESSNVSNSLIMEGATIGKNCKVEYAVIDKDVFITDNTHIIGSPDNIVSIEKGEVL